jgi:transcriptional regulator with XRE-family HTH domain
MPQARVLDPGSSLLAFFGAELRRRRTAAGLSQDQLGQAITYSAALVGRVEVGERMPSLDLAERCDDVLATGGLFAHLRQSMDSDMHAYPAWFREFVEREREATSIREFSALAGQPTVTRKSKAASPRDWNVSGFWTGASRRCSGSSWTRACYGGRSAAPGCSGLSSPIWPQWPGTPE